MKNSPRRETSIAPKPALAASPKTKKTKAPAPVIIDIQFNALAQKYYSLPDPAEQGFPKASHLSGAECDVVAEILSSNVTALRARAEALACRN